MSFFEDMFDSASEWFSGEGASTVASSFDSIVQGAQLVGGVLAVAGAVTGNKKLLRIGSTIGIGATAISALNGLLESASAPKMIDSGSDGAKKRAAESSSLPYVEASKTIPEAEFVAASPTESESRGGLIGSRIADHQVPASTELATEATFPKRPSSIEPTLKTSSDTPLSAGSASGAEGLRVRNSSIGEETGIAAQSAKKLQSPDGGVKTGQSNGLIGSALGLLNNNPGIVKIGAGLIGGAVQGYQQDSALRKQQQMIDDQRARFNRSILDQNINRSY